MDLYGAVSTPVRVVIARINEAKIGIQRILENTRVYYEI